MTTKKASTKEQIMEALKKNKITTLEEFIETLMPSETGGFVFGVSGMAEEMTLGLNFLTKVQRGAQGLWLSEEAQELKDNPVINDEIF